MKTEKVRIKGGYVKITTGHRGFDYEFELTRCDTRDKLLHWVAHLSQKVWMKGPMVTELIEAVYKKNGWGTVWSYNT